MRHDKNHTDFEDGHDALPVTASLSSLRIAAQRLSDTRKRPKLKTRDLVGLLLSHGARAWRSSLPMAHVNLKVSMPDGAPAVRYVYRQTVRVS